jgi:predicted RNase H-like HicB family nuclease
MSKGDRYVKLVEWSDEDASFIGSCPELFYCG